MSTSHLFIFNRPATSIDLHQFIDIHYRILGPCSKIRTHKIFGHCPTPAWPRWTGTRTAIKLALLFLWWTCFLLWVNYSLHILCSRRCHEILPAYTVLWNLSLMVCYYLRHVGVWMVLIMSLKLLVMDVLTSSYILTNRHVICSYLLNLL